jgi:hypothetical protein
MSTLSMKAMKMQQLVGLKEAIKEYDDDSGVS